MAKNTPRIAHLVTETDRVLVLRSNPTIADVRVFVKEHNRRYTQGEAGGPDGMDLHGDPLDAERIVAAVFYPTENDIGDESKATPVDLKNSDLAPDKG